MRRQILMKFDTLADVFGPIIGILDLKSRDMDRATAAAERMKCWMRGEAMPQETETDEADAVDREMTLMEAVHTQRAFANFGEDQARMVRAADYADDWLAAETCWRTCRRLSAAPRSCSARGSSDATTLEPDSVFGFPVPVFRQMERFCWDQLYNPPSRTKHCAKPPALKDATVADSVAAMPGEEL